VRFLRAIIAVVLLATVAVAQGDTRATTYTTTAPSSGSSIVVYHWEASVNGGAYSEVATSTGLSVTLALPWNATVTVRVRGKDADGDFGPYSPVSDPFTPDRPGACGKPTRS